MFTYLIVTPVLTLKKTVSFISYCLFKVVVHSLIQVTASKKV